MAKISTSRLRVPFSESTVCSCRPCGDGEAGVLPTFRRGELNDFRRQSQAWEWIRASLQWAINGISRKTERPPVESRPDGVYTRAYTSRNRSHQPHMPTMGSPWQPKHCNWNPKPANGRRPRAEPKTKNRKAKNLFHKFPIQNVIKPLPGSAAHLITGNVASSRAGAGAGAGRACLKKDARGRAGERGGRRIRNILDNCKRKAEPQEQRQIKAMPSWSWSISINIFKVIKFHTCWRCAELF